MIRLVALYGVGDAYLVCGLVRAFEQHHGIGACVVVKSAQVAIPQMFGVHFEVDDALVRTAEGNHRFHCTYDNDIDDGHIFYVHPQFIRSRVRIDQLTVKARVSQADMYRALLRLQPWALLETPQRGHYQTNAEVILIPRARSWPNLPDEFWQALAKRLHARLIDSGKPLGNLFADCGGAKHVIGAQCGVMSVLIEAGFLCRKTIAITELSSANPYLFGLTETMPYGHASTFAGNEHPEVSHFVVSPTNWEAVIEGIAAEV